MIFISIAIRRHGNIVRDVSTSFTYIYVYWSFGSSKEHSQNVENVRL